MEIENESLEDSRQIVTHKININFNNVRAVYFVFCMLEEHVD